MTFVRPDRPPTADLRPFYEAVLPDEAATLDLAARLATCLRAGDVLLLSGPIGAGKSFLARGLIRACLGDPAAEVPSPTYTLVQTYATATLEIWHADLYRLSGPDEAIELGLDAAFETALCLIEWPDRLAEMAPESALHVRMAAGLDHHRIALAGGGDWPDRLQACLDRDC